MKGLQVVVLCLFGFVVLILEYLVLGFVVLEIEYFVALFPALVLLCFVARSLLGPGQREETESFRRSLSIG